MTSRTLAAAVCGTLLAVGGSRITAQTKPVTIQMKDGQGQAVGTATISPDGSGVKIALDVKNLAAGEHAVHVHQVAKCEGPNFASAGPHFNPEMKKHGLQNPEGAHAGDMNNFTVAADGTSKATVSNAKVTLGEGANSLYTGGGTALVIHAKADDMKTDPAGNAGDRFACGVITK